MQTIVNLGTGGADLNGQNGSTSSADSNDALFLDWPGDNAGNYLYCAGGDGNYPTVPDEAALDITGAIDLRFYVAMESYTYADFGTSHALVAKGTTNNTFNYRVLLRNPSNMEFRFGTGATSYTATSSVQINTVVNDGDAIWLRVTHDPSVGEVKFYYGDDGTSWTQLGTTQSITAATPTTNSDSLEIMGRGVIAQSGKLYRAQIFDGIDGTKVLDVDTSAISSGSDTSFSALTGQTVTINRSTSGRKSVAVVSPVWLFGTDDFMQVANDARLALDASKSYTMIVVARQWNTPPNFARFVATRGPSGGGFNILNNGTTLDVTMQIFDGANGNAFIRPTLVAGATSIFGMTIDRSQQELVSFSNGVFENAADISSVGDVPMLNELRISGRPVDGTGSQDMELLAFAFVERLLTTTEISALTTYYQNRWS